MIAAPQDTKRTGEVTNRQLARVLWPLFRPRLGHFVGAFFLLMISEIGTIAGPLLVREAIDVDIGSRNLVGLERSGFSREQIRSLQRAFNQLFGDEGTFEERLDTVEREFSAEMQVRNIIRFAREKTRFPLCQPPKKVA